MSASERGRDADADPDQGREVLRLEAVVRGRVQGVGFRYWVVRRSKDLGLTGWVANELDGSRPVRRRRRDRFAR